MNKFIIINHIVYVKQISFFFPLFFYAHSPFGDIYLSPFELTNEKEMTFQLNQHHPDGRDMKN